METSAKAYVIASVPLLFQNGPAILIAPSRNDWNDFGYRLLVNVYAADNSGNISEITKFGRLLIEGTNQSSDALANVKHPYPIGDGQIAGKKFLLSLSDRPSYKKVIKILGMDTAKACLLAAQDIAAMYAYERQSLETHSLFSSEGFRRGLIRTSESYFAYIGFQRLIADASVPSGTASISKVSLGVTLNASESINVEFTFDRSPLGEHLIAAMIGPNGIGKTRMLTEIARRLRNPRSDWTQDDEVASGESNKLDPQSVSVVVLTPEPARWTDLKQAGGIVDSIAVDDPTWTNIARDIVAVIRRPAEAFQADDPYSWLAFRRLLSENIPGASLHLRTVNGDSIAASSIRYFESQTTLDTLASIDVSAPPTLRLSEGEEVIPSSGQKALIVTLLKLFLYSESGGTLFLIDEPETHLHPQFIGSLIAALHNTLSATRSVAIIATHSPYVIREIERKGVFVLRKDEGGATEIARPSLQTRGASIAEISEYVFEEKRVPSPLLEQQLRIAIANTENRKLDHLLAELGPLFGSRQREVILKILKEQDANND